MSKLNCPRCGHWAQGEIYDVGSKHSDDGLSVVWRRRRCADCHTPYSTVEVVKDELISIALAALEKRVAQEEAHRRKEAEKQQRKLRRQLRKSVVAGATEVCTEPPPD